MRATDFLRLLKIIRRGFFLLAILPLFVFSACVPLDVEKMAITIDDQQKDLVLGVATFAGGCFWCTEADFDKLHGVVSTTSGYIGGVEENPTYEQVVIGKTGHVEAVRVQYDAAKTSFAELLAAYWRTIDPVSQNRQFCDTGAQYRSIIFYHNEEQHALAKSSKAALEASGRFIQPIVTEVKPVTKFYPAEAYHQDYHLKNPIRYRYYRNKCGRDQRLEDLWGEKR